jgi:NAD(P)-dependent dehydrogenase (short-subunit alcohol dehydrogenase family)
LKKEKAMNLQEVTKAYDFTGKTVAITGGGGVLCGEMAKCLAGCNANIIILDRDMSLGEKVLSTLGGTQGKHKAIFIDVLDKVKVQEAADKTLAEYGRVDILINGAGGNNPKATTSAEVSFFDIPAEAIQFVSNLNLIGTILPSQVFGRADGNPERRNYSQCFFNERFPAADTYSGLLSSKSCNQQLYTMAGSSYGAGVYTEHSGQRNCTRIFLN